MRSSRQTVQSAEVGGEVLKALARLAPAAALTEIGDELGMPVAKVHRYLKALIASGLAEQDPNTGRYQLGPESLHIGLAALDRVDVVAVASQYLPALCEGLRQSCFLSVFGNRGPTVVRAVAVASAVTFITRVGTVLPLLGSATGLVFAAFIDGLDVDGLAPPELARLRLEVVEKGPIVAARLAEVRTQGQAIVHGLFMPGIDSIAVPVFGLGGLVVAGLTALGPHDGFDTAADGPIATRLRETAARVGTQLGSAPARRFGHNTR